MTSLNNNYKIIQKTNAQQQKCSEMLQQRQYFNLQQQKQLKNYIIYKLIPIMMLQFHLSQIKVFFKFIKKKNSVLKAFDIQLLILSSFKTQAEKNQYVQSCMEKTINNLINNFRERLELKERKQYEQEKKENSKSHQKQKDDYFPWLKVKTKYESLRKRLNAIVIEKLNDVNKKNIFNNLIYLKNKIFRKKTQATHVKFQMKNAPLKSTKDIFQNMSTYGNPRTQQFLSRLGLSNNQNDKVNDGRLSYQVKDSNGFQQIQKKQQESQFFPDNNKKQNEQNTGGKENFWDNKKEKQFKQYRLDKKQLYYNEVNSSSWNDVGFLPFVQRYIINMKKQMQRDHLLNKYAEGENLTIEELKLLANTSELLNSCIDKKFMQNAVDIIDEDVISNLELGLAEDILKNYEEIQILVKESRQQFIANQLKQNYIKFKQYDIAKAKQYEKNEYMKVHMKNYKMLAQICYKMEKEGKFKEQLPVNIKGFDKLVNFIEGKITQEELIKDIKQINFYADEIEDKDQIEKHKQLQKVKQQQNFNNYINNISQPKNQSSRNFKQDYIRHVYHPPSKIFKTQEERNFQEHTAEEQIKYSQLDTVKNKVNKNQQEKYKLNLKSSKVLRNNSNFKRFYSGGPSKHAKEQHQYKINDYKAKIEQIRNISKQNIKIQVLQDKKNIEIISLDDNQKPINQISTQTNINFNTLETRQSIRKDSIQQFRPKTALNICSSIKEDQQFQFLNTFQNPYSTTLTTFCPELSSDLSHYQFKRTVEQLNEKHIKKQLRNVKLIDAAKQNLLWKVNTDRFVFCKRDFYFAVDENGWTALHWATHHQNIDFIQWLIDQGSDPNQPDQKGDTPVHLAFKGNKLEVIYKKKLDIFFQFFFLFKRLLKLLLMEGEIQIILIIKGRLHLFLLVKICQIYQVYRRVEDLKMKILLIIIVQLNFQLNLKQSNKNNYLIHRNQQEASLLYNKVHYPFNLEIIIVFPNNKVLFTFDQIFFI
ncbi:IQ calmodulin-binding motif family protein, putative [Ichthyophthirius multifiliis]|uniref:IQ calmodulin-binding motif family protein, putative n=1 Tax=Ichthyophthirius multifiliis TaxID=5932 RepID=G0QW05_ICHMU|nr:IQ calmodulin-binding motif family protein, putative [Ichthyophthirius multifiliis]EGR30598.1 IQ calmodulin-binding motif family protein, putative [Ichthyophthirius multifiliis]|eukprot:XP_004032185.1 IQ calmodulin-binding motif family protein, putative [Ichthyophthirius multifiliis]